jgi:hypothetical protein
MPPRKPPPTNARSGPRIAQPGNRPSKSTSAATAKQQGITPTGTILGAGRHKRDGYPVASASLYAPVAGRVRWWLSVRCPFCGGIHLCRLSEESLAEGPRKLRCGRAWVTVRRVYRPTAASAEAGVAA